MSKKKELLPQTMDLFSELELERLPERVFRLRGG